jgi:hypothetical protein
MTKQTLERLKNQPTINKKQFHKNSMRNLLQNPMRSTTTPQTTRSNTTTIPTTQQMIARSIIPRTKQMENPNTKRKQKMNLPQIIS